MDSFEYIVVFVSIILGLSVTRILSGVSEMMHSRRFGGASWVHGIWVLNIFLYNLVVWWATYRWRVVENWDFFLFVYVLATPLLLYLLSALLFPDPDEPIDITTHFHQVRRWFFALLSVLPLLDVGDSLLKGREHFANLGPMYVIGMVALFTASLIGGTPRPRRPSYYAVFGAIFGVYLLVFITINLRELR